MLKDALKVDFSRFLLKWQYFSTQRRAINGPPAIGH